MSIEVLYFSIKFSRTTCSVPYSELAMFTREIKIEKKIFFPNF